ncbi:MAG: hypothetical protein ABSH56_28765 [Bryobacteraceae bacterium]
MAELTVPVSCRTIPIRAYPDGAGPIHVKRLSAVRQAQIFGNLQEVPLPVLSQATAISADPQGSVKIFRKGLHYIAFELPCVLAIEHYKSGAIESG